MQESTIPLITAITMLGIITLLFFVNEFFRKYKVVKKWKQRKRKNNYILFKVQISSINEPEHIYKDRLAEAEKRWNDMLNNKTTNKK